MTDRPGNGDGDDDAPAASPVSANAPGSPTAPPDEPDALLLPVRSRADRAAVESSASVSSPPPVIVESTAEAAAAAPADPAASPEAGEVAAPTATSPSSPELSSARHAPTPIPSLRDEEDDDDGEGEPPRPRNRKTAVISAVAIAVGLTAAVVFFIGRANSERYAIACEADRAVVEHGRAFPPWGTRRLAGAEWAPLKIPPEAECTSLETTDLGELARNYLGMILKQASTLLTAREVTKIDDAEAQLQQALLVTRSLTNDGARGEQRKEIERLLGDVAYWRASAKLRLAADSLSDAARQFDAAAVQRPRHVTDAAEWAAHVRKIVERLRGGPGGDQPSAFPPSPPDAKPSAPPGIALPVQPPGDAGVAPVESIDAGLPAGGVLL
ncbi:MAG: hypothetical protein AB7O24_02860 [Kofleriaceae bacterium]